MPKNIAIYRGYTIIIHQADAPNQARRAVIWACSSELPILMPNCSTENEAIDQAWAAVDHLLGGGEPP
jgi:hypothetical protein